MDWLHWIGNQYYTLDGFIDEAKQHGVSRRIQERVLRSMTWNDRIFVATNIIETVMVRGKIKEQIKKIVKTPVIFGFFRIETLHGINLSEIPAELRQNFARTTYNGGRPSTVRRGCGTQKNYGLYLETDVAVQNLIDLNSVTGDTEIKGGLRVFNNPVIMRGLFGFRGFMKFDGVTFMKDAVKDVCERVSTNTLDEQTSLHMGYQIG